MSKFTEEQLDEIALAVAEQAVQTYNYNFSGDYPPEEHYADVVNDPEREINDAIFLEDYGAIESDLPHIAGAIKERLATIFEHAAFIESYRAGFSTEVAEKALAGELVN